MGDGANTTDYSKSKWAVWVPIIVNVMTTLVGGIGWGITQYLAREKEAQETR
jgi:hypothetical protein